MTQLEQALKLGAAFDAADERNDVEAMFDLSAKLTAIWEEIFTEEELMDLLAEA